MKLSQALQEKQDKILSTWVERTLDSYRSSGFFKQSRDPIANPVGANISAGLASILDLLLKDAAPEEYTAPLDQVIRIRAIQDFTPSQAVVPFLELKWIIRQMLADITEITDLDRELAKLDCAVDRIALAAFDIYTECRERLYQVRIKEIKSGNYILADTPCSSALLRKGQKGPEKIN